MGESTRICRICSIEDTLPEDVSEYRNRLLRLLPEEQKASEKQFHMRLITCENCDKLSEGTCLSCGCYVQIRAAVFDKHCPLHLW